MARLLSCKAYNGQIYDLAGTPFTIAEGETRLSVVTDLAAEDSDLSQAYFRRATELLSALIEAKRQRLSAANDEGDDTPPPCPAIAYGVAA